MNVKPILAILAGTVVSFGLRAVLYGMLLQDFFARYSVHYAGLEKESINQWAVMLSSLLWVAGITYVIMKSSDKRNFITGLITAGIVAFFICASLDVMYSAGWNLYSKRALAADVALTTVITGISGGVVGLILGWGKKS